MKREFDDALLSSGNVLRRSCSLVVENAGKTVALITALVAVLVSFTEIGFCGFNAASLGVELAVVLLATYVIYFSLEDSGERLGRESEAYRAAEEKYRNLCGRIGGERTRELRDFCASYSEQELEYRRMELLLRLGITREEYTRRTENGERKAKKAYRRVARQKPLRLTPALLLGNGRSAPRSELSDPGRGKYLRMFVSLIPTALCTVFTVSIILVGKEDMTAITVIESLLKLACLPIVAIRGYSRGYAYIVESECAWLDTKSRLLEDFLTRDATKAA